MYTVRAYDVSLESQWVALRARIAARSHTWDFIEREKVKYENLVVELVLLSDDVLIGYLDAEIEPAPGKICWESDTRGAIIQEFGIAVGYQKKGLSHLLLRELERSLLQQGIHRAEFWTKDLKSASFYRHLNFREIFHHDHFRLLPRGFLPEGAELPFRVKYGYFVRNAGLSEPEDAIHQPPLKSQACYGFEWRF